MPEFDAERYLRRLGEREVVAGASVSRRRRHGDLWEAASALVSCEVLDPAVAAPVLDGYAVAFAMRGMPRIAPAQPDPPRQPRAAPLEPRRPASGGIDVSTEQLRPASPAIAHIWQLLSDFTDIDPDPASGEGALRALLAAGLISRQDPELEALAWVKGHSAPERLPRRAGWLPAAPETPPATVPPGWRGLTNGRTGAFIGVERTVPVQVVTPVFDGVCIAVDTLTSTPHTFAVELEMSSALPSRPVWGLPARSPVSIWARDDRDNAYLGHVVEWTGGHPELAWGSGTVEFTALDPAAGELVLLPQTARARAVIRIPL
jgi:hypothetical protein